ncbi:Uncharacterized membrane protein [Sphingobium faniae]|nr:Uncharacterized membrane protein [Sphingobium faniae]
MRVMAPVLLILAALAGCGAQEHGPAENNAAATAGMTGAPIVDNSAAANNVAQPANAARPAPVRREEPSPAPALAPRSDQGYHAIGTEPFWAVTVEGSTATLERPGKTVTRFAVTRRDDPRTIRYLGETFSMTVSEGPCSDGMSDSIWSDRVQVAFGEGTLKGCGGERDDRGMGPP